MIVLLILTISFVAITGYIGNSYGIAKKVHERKMIQLAESHAAFYVLHTEESSTSVMSENINGMTQEMLNSFGDGEKKYSATITNVTPAASISYVQNFVVHIFYGTAEPGTPGATYTQVTVPEAT